MSSESDPPGGEDMADDDTRIVTIKDVYREVSKLNGAVIRFEGMIERATTTAEKSQTSADEALKQITGMQIEFASFKAKWAVISTVIAAGVPILFKMLHLI